MTSPTVAEDAMDPRYRAVLTGVEVDLAHLRELRAEGASGDHAERALRERGEDELRSARSTRAVAEEAPDDAEAR